MAMGASLEIHNASKYYKKFKAVDSVDLSVKKGEFLTILGPSGSGKTSLLKLIAGFEELSEGSITLDKKEITKQKAYERNIGMLFQNYALFPHMTVAQNISYPLKIRKMQKPQIEAEVKKILDLVQLEEFGSRFPHQLSGGQQQRVALARAIVFNPPLILLDEPLAALDKHLRQQMQLEIKHIQEKVGITTISVTHDQEEALTMSDRICVMNRGRIEQIDTPENLYCRPKSRFVAEFIGEINLLPGEVIDCSGQTISVRLDQDTVIRVKRNQADNEPANQAFDLNGTARFVAIRPEHLRPALQQNRFGNTLTVQISDKIYIGEAVKIKAEYKNKHNLLLKVPASEAANLVVGNRISIGWNEEDAILIQNK